MGQQTVIKLATPGPGYAATSVSSITIGTGSKTFVTQAGLAYSSGALVILSPVSTPADYLVGTVTSYSGSTLVVNVTATNGAGTFASWTLNLAGPVGPTGTTGGAGPAGLTGTAGPGFVARGAWSNVTTYAQGDQVSSGGGLWLSLAASNTAHSPAISPAWWQNVVASFGPGGWQSIALLNGWTAFAGYRPTPSYRLEADGNTVRIAGVVSGGAVGSGTVVFLFGASYVPPSFRLIAGVNNLGANGLLVGSGGLQLVELGSSTIGNTYLSIEGTFTLT